MDVVLRQVGPEPTDWSLTDRLGRALGAVHKSGKPAKFEITPQDGTSLQGIKAVYPTLDEVMTAIAIRMAGSCSLDSREEAKPHLEGLGGEIDPK